MKIKKIRQLIAVLKSIPAAEYDQTNWIGDGDCHCCGTSACLAGHAVLMEKNIIDKHGRKFYSGRPKAEFCSYGQISKTAAGILGISLREAGILFDSRNRGWRNQQRASNSVTRKSDLEIAIKELEDMLRLGTYWKRKDRKQERIAARQQRLALSRKKRIHSRTSQHIVSIQIPGSEEPIDARQTAHAEKIPPASPA
jgi:hypothetical protein